MEPTRTKVGRLAFRVEGDNWVCYYAMPSTMEGAIWMGSIRMAIVENQDCKELFMSTMKRALEKFLPAIESWREPEQAPEHERSGSA